MISQRRIMRAIPVAFLTALSACGAENTSSGDGATPPPEVTVARPAVAEITEWDDYTGRFQAVESVDIRARVSGYLESIHFTDGAVVEKGDLLFVIDPRPFEAALARAEAQLVEAQTRLDLAEKNLLRAADLLDDGNISRQIYDQRMQERDGAAAALAAAQAAVKSARLDLGFTRITAPVSGLISREFVSVGNLVSGGSADSTLLTRINTIDPIHVYFDADESAYLKYVRLDRTGERISSREAANPVRVSLVDEEGFPHRGHMDFVDNQIDAQTGTIRGRAILDNPDHLMVPGMFARVQLQGKGPYDAILLPDEAITMDQARRVVYVLEDGDTVAPRAVETGPKTRGLRVIRSGVERSDRVVIKGIQRLRPGMTVSASEASISTDASAAENGAGGQ